MVSESPPCEVTPPSAPVPPPPAPRQGPASAAAPPVIDTHTLFGDGREVRLNHQGVEYRLRITRQGKLILTK